VFGPDVKTRFHGSLGGRTRSLVVGHETPRTGCQGLCRRQGHLVWWRGMGILRARRGVGGGHGQRILQGFGCGDVGLGAWRVLWT
jgi:hypothetical protein